MSGVACEARLTVLPCCQALESALAEARHEVEMARQTHSAAAEGAASALAAAEARERDAAFGREQAGHIPTAQP